MRIGVKPCSICWASDDVAYSSFSIEAGRCGLRVLWFFIGGIAHFVAIETEMRIVPPWVPWPRAAVLVSGVLELVGAVGLLRRPTRRAAGIGLFLLTIAVTPCHVYMLQQPELFPAIPIWALWLRLPIQVALLALIAWCSAPDRRDADGLSYHRPL